MTAATNLLRARMQLLIAAERSGDVAEMSYWRRLYNMALIRFARAK